VKGWKHVEWGDTFSVDVPLDEAEASDYERCSCPGGIGGCKGDRRPRRQRFDIGWFRGIAMTEEADAVAKRMLLLPGQSRPGG
jgi:hypothetical protein